jgi:hypothetical protein
MDAASLPNPELMQQVETVWHAQVQPLGCPLCKQVFLGAAAYEKHACPQCAQANLALQPAWLRPEPPELVVPFEVDSPRLARALEEFTQGVWLAQVDFNPRDLMARAVPIFWPVWLLDSDVDGNWETEAGYPYQVKSSREDYAAGSWQSREVIEDRLRWEPRVGQIHRHYDNVSAPALSDYAALTQAAGAYRFDQARSYDPACLGGAAVRVPDLAPEETWPRAEKSLRDLAARDCLKASGAAQLRNFVLHPAYANLHWTQMLLPLYVTHYSDDEGHPIWVRVNGQSGVVNGTRQPSPRRAWRATAIAFVCALVVLLLGLLGVALAALFPPAAILGVLFVVLGLLGVIASLTPIIWVWRSKAAPTS